MYLMHIAVLIQSKLPRLNNQHNPMNVLMIVKFYLILSLKN